MTSLLKMKLPKPLRCFFLLVLYLYYNEQSLGYFRRVERKQPLFNPLAPCPNWAIGKLNPPRTGGHAAEEVNAQSTRLSLSLSAVALVICAELEFLLSIFRG